MIDNTNIVDWLNELVNKRNNELSENEEFNNWTEVEAHDYQNRTNTISAAVEELNTENDKSISELNDLKSKYAYLAADFDNYKKRSAKNIAYALDKGIKNTILSFLTIYDDIERLVQTIKYSDYPENTEEKVDLTKSESGFILIYENIEKTLKALGCEKVECGYGDKFNVDTMEAISTREIRDDEGYDPDDVVEIFQSGWKYNNALIRPAKVVVGK